jgi:Ser/Thr protein kinase RdoA (MazF antagonist)
LFERLTHEQLPFYLYLMKHLAERGIEVPDPQSNRQGDILLTLGDKPAAVVNRLAGSLATAPQGCTLRTPWVHLGARCIWLHMTLTSNNPICEA